MAGDDDLFGAEHVRVYRETRGERGYHWRGTTILLLSTTGRSSGQERTTPLIHRTDGDRWVIVASKGGAPEHPGWFQNLQAHPEAKPEATAWRKHSNVCKNPKDQKELNTWLTELSQTAVALKRKLA